MNFALEVLLASILAPLAFGTLLGALGVILGTWPAWTGAAVAAVFVFYGVPVIVPVNTAILGLLSRRFFARAVSTRPRRCGIGLVLGALIASAIGPCIYLTNEAVTGHSFPLTTKGIVAAILLGGLSGAIAGAGGIGRNLAEKGALERGVASRRG